MLSELAELVLATKAQVMRETKLGGTLTDLPCPFCGKPRSLRSEYVRCQPCGANWWDGTDLTRNPHAKPSPSGKILRMDEVRGSSADPAKERFEL